MEESKIVGGLLDTALKDFPAIDNVDPRPCGLQLGGDGARLANDQRHGVDRVPEVDAEHDLAAAPFDTPVLEIRIPLRELRPRLARHCTAAHLRRK